LLRTPLIILHKGILALQSNKRELAKAALSGESAKNLMKLTLNDIMSSSSITRSDTLADDFFRLDLFKRSSGPDDDDDDDDTDDQSNETYR